MYFTISLAYENSWKTSWNYNYPKNVKLPLARVKRKSEHYIVPSYFNINKGHDHILLLDNGKNEEKHGKITEDTFQRN